MICTSKIQAERVAEEGAIRMHGLGYYAVRSLSNPNVWRCYRPAGKPGPAFYFVQVGKMPVTCPCAFFRNNRRFQTCKHIRFCQAEAEAQDYCREHGLLPELVAANFDPNLLKLLVSNATVASI